ncbi:MAG: Rqc2 family fibronectin-binding protein [Oscillochloridaceae bacterium umkhey_bin13]
MKLKEIGMYFDALTLAAVVDELRATILGGRVQRVVQTGPLSLGFELYAHGRRYHLLASAHPQLARLHLSEGRLSRGVAQDTPLLLLLRKYVLGGRIVAIEQPALERVVLCSIVKAPAIRNRRGPADPALEADEAEFDEDAEAELDAPETAPWLPQERLVEPAEPLRCELIIEPQDRRSNLILVDDDNRILDSIKRVTPRMSSRVIMPRQIYELPPALERRDPTRATAAGIAALADEGERDLARALVKAYRGLSPQTARELVFRVLGRTKVSVDEPDLPHFSLAARLRDLMSAPPEPCLLLGPDGPLGYAPYALTHVPGATALPSMSAVLDAFYQARETVTGHAQRREALTQQLAGARERIARQYDQLATELERAQGLERLRWEGEMIFAFLHSLQPGQTSLVIEGETITLDPRQTSVEQAQERFRQYDKAKSALAGLPERMEATALRLQSLDELVALLQLSDEYNQIEQLAQEAEELGYLREHPDPTAKRRPRPPKARPLRVLAPDGHEIAIGRSARQNEEVTFRIGRPEDLWLHVRTIHGSHVILRTGGREPSEPTLLLAAGLAAYFSQARAEPLVEVDICRRALVRKIPGGPPGLVTYRAERTVRVAPLPPEATSQSS